MTTVGSLGSSQVTSQIATVQARLQAPVTSLNKQVTADKANISAWGNISGAMSTLSNSLAGIKDVATINNRTATTSSSTVATATAAIGAQTGTYNLTGVTLAKTQEIYSAVLGSGAAKLTGGAGALTFTLKNGKTASVSVGSGSLTLNGVAAAINKTPGGVQASVIGTATGARLVLQSSSTGSSQGFSVTGTGALAQFAYASGAATSGTETRAQTASNAALAINGVPVTSTTNTVGSAISGLTINLAGSGNTSISVSSAPTGLSAAVGGVAGSLNAAIALIAKETKFVPPSSAASASAAKSGPLLGNFTATDLASKLLSAVSGAAASGLSANAIGLTVSSAGAVAFKGSAFTAAYAKNPTGVQALVSQIYKTLNTITTGAIGGSGSSTNTSGTSTKNTGSIGAQTASLSGVITSIDSQVAAITKENNTQIQQLITQYTAAENAAAAASITQSYLSIFTSTSSSTTG